MGLKQLPASFTPFHLLTPRLILLPTPLALHIPPYLTLYASLHASTLFTTTAFGDTWEAREWDEKEVYEVVRREVERSWEVRGMGDFAVGLRADGVEDGESEGSWEGVEWVGYVGLRDGKLSMPQDPSLPSWEDLRYGFSPTSWRKGYGTESLSRLLIWGKEEKGIRKFVAETVKANSASAGLLKKCGFVASDTDYWKNKETLDEWEYTPDATATSTS